MFDNLKEKLGSFRDDAEEAAEENATEVSEEETDTTATVDESGEQADESIPAQQSDEGTTDPAASAVESTPSSADPETAAEPPTSSDDAVDTDSDGVVAERKQVDDPGDDSPQQVNDDEGASVDVGESGDENVSDDSAAEATLDSENVSDDDSDSNGTGIGRKARSIVRGKFVIEEDDLQDPLDELELALLSSDVEMGVTEELLENIRAELIGETRTFTTSTGAVVEDALRDALYDVISVGQFDFDERIANAAKPVVIVFTGVNGVGKTTTIAKLHQYFESQGYATVLANGDTYRAGANEQMQEHAAALDAKLISHEQGGDPAAVLYDAVEYAEANDVDIVLGDTAGRLHTDEDLMAQLEKIDRVVDPDMVLFVDEAVAGQDAVNRAREFNDAASIDGAVLTKADADSNGGAAISIAQVTGKPILFLGVGQGYDDIERFDPDDMIDRLLADEE